MYGAILGDIIGSPFEFDRGDKTKNFDLFTKGCDFTDDTVMTVAVAEALLAAEPDTSLEEIKASVVSAMRDWGTRYPDAGYGGRFGRWLYEKDPKPYNSYGNGSAMRVSAAGWLYESLDKTRQIARATAEVTHNHPEGIKGAEATASAIYLARNGASKEEIKAYVEKEFHYDLNRTLAEIRPHFHMDETCQRTVPEAIIAFLEADGFEDSIRNAVSLGGDTDTLAAITGSIAEAYFGIPAMLIAECRMRVDSGLMTDIIDEFDYQLGRDKTENRWLKPDMTGNEAIEASIEQLSAKDTKENVRCLVGAIIGAMISEEEFIVPYISDTPLMTEEQAQNAKIGQTFSIDHEIRLKMETVLDADDMSEWICAFTSQEEINKGDFGNIRISQPIKELLRLALDWEKVSGLVINPFGKYARLEEDMIKFILEQYDEIEKEEAPNE